MKLQTYIFCAMCFLKYIGVRIVLKQTSSLLKFELVAETDIYGVGKHSN